MARQIHPFTIRKMNVRNKLTCRIHSHCHYRYPLQNIILCLGVFFARPFVVYEPFEKCQVKIEYFSKFFRHPIKRIEHNPGGPSPYHTVPSPLFIHRQNETELRGATPNFSPYVNDIKSPDGNGYPQRSLRIQ